MIINCAFEPEFGNYTEEIFNSNLINTFLHILKKYCPVMTHTQTTHTHTIQVTNKKERDHLFFSD